MTSRWGGEREGVLGHLLYLAEGDNEDATEFRTHIIGEVLKLNSDRGWLKAVKMLTDKMDEELMSGLRHG